MLKIFPQIKIPRWFGQTYDVVSVWKNVDVTLVVAITLQSIIGALTVYSATRQRLINQGFDEFFYVHMNSTPFINVWIPWLIVYFVSLSLLCRLDSYTNGRRCVYFFI